MKTFKILLVALLLFAFNFAQAWRIDNGYVVVEKGDNLFKIAHSLFGKGIEYDKIWNARLDSFSKNPNWIYDGMRFKIAEVAQPSSLKDTCCNKKVTVNNNYNLDKNDADRPDCDWLKSMMIDFGRITLFPSLALLLAYCIKKKYEHSIDYKTILLITFGGIVALVLANNIGYKKINSNSKINHSIDTASIRQLKSIPLLSSNLNRIKDTSTIGQQSSSASFKFLRDSLYITQKGFLALTIDTIKLSNIPSHNERPRSRYWPQIFGLLTLAVIGLLFLVWAYLILKQKQTRNRIKRRVYLSYIDSFLKDSIIDEDKHMRNRLFVYGSDRVIKAYNRWHFSISDKTDREYKQHLFNLMLLEIRKDVFRNTKLTLEDFIFFQKR